ncbi:MAG: hypothetical protein NVSMB9_35380 [Isosphaeraceae bacterium]
MLIELTEFMHRLSPSMTVGLMVVFIVGLVTLIAMTAIIGGLWKAARKDRVNFELKRMMIERGMSADEIVRVLSVGGARTADTEPCASEVVVDWLGDWYPALILKRAEGSYYVHYIGHEMSENEWVEEARVRFSARPGQCDTDPRPAPSWKGPVEAEV